MVMTAITAPPRSLSGRLIGLVVAVAVVAAAAVIGSLAASGASAEYTALARPSWAPPSWLLGPVWTVLYAGMR
jgi:translocator protein